MIYQEKLKFYQKNKVIIFCKNLKIFFEALLNKVAGLQCLFQKHLRADASVLMSTFDNLCF